jgi:hypothetical protein
VPAALLAALAPLVALTQLELVRASMTLEAQAALPRRLHVLLLRDVHYPAGIDLAHMAALRGLDLAASCGVACAYAPEAACAGVAAVLPRGLLALTVLAAHTRRLRLQLRQVRAAGVVHACALRLCVCVQGGGSGQLLST